VNDWIGEEVIRFKPYELAQPSEGPVKIPTK
jgi:hypothetical protein